MTLMFCQAQSDEAKIDLVKALPRRLLSLGSSVDEMANHNIGAADVESLDAAIPAGSREDVATFASAERA